MNLRTEEKEKKEYVLFILDRSGSMEQIRNSTISGLNEQIQELKKTADKIDTYVSLVLFDSNVEFQRWNVPINDFEEIKPEDYIPKGMTAMLDGVGQSISRLKNEIDDTKDDISFLVIIVSDGAENSSKEYDYGGVAKIITDLKDKGNWTITYMGANQDLSVVAQNLNINTGNIMNWTTTNSGTNAAYATMDNSLHVYRSRRVDSPAIVRACAAAPTFYSDQSQNNNTPNSTN